MTTFAIIFLVLLNIYTSYRGHLADKEKIEVIKEHDMLVDKINNLRNDYNHVIKLNTKIVEERKALREELTKLNESKISPFLEAKYTSRIAALEAEVDKANRKEDVVGRIADRYARNAAAALKEIRRTYGVAWINGLIIQDDRYKADEEYNKDIEELKKTNNITETA